MHINLRRNGFMLYKYEFSLSNSRYSYNRALLIRTCMKLGHVFYHTREKCSQRFIKENSISRGCNVPKQVSQKLKVIQRALSLFGKEGREVQCFTIN